MTDDKRSKLDAVESQIARLYHDIGRGHELKHEMCAQIDELHAAQAACDTRIARQRAALAGLKTQAAGILAAGDEA